MENETWCLTGEGWMLVVNGLWLDVVDRGCHWHMNWVDDDQKWSFENSVTIKKGREQNQ